MHALRTTLAGAVALTLATAAVIVAAPTASAATDDVTGLEFTDNGDGTATITGCPYYCADPNVVVPATVQSGASTYDVTAIGDGAFESEYLNSVTLPEGLESIGDSAFADNYLGATTLPSTLTHVGSDAFAWAELGEVTLPAGLTSVAQSAFRSSGITDITWQTAPTSIAAGAFAQNDLEELEVPASVTSIGDFAFSSNGSLTTVTLPAGLQHIGHGAFSGAWILESVTYPGAPSPGSPALPPSLTSIGDYAFEYAILSGHLELPSGLTSLGMGAFDANSLTSITLPESLTVLRNSAFGGNALTDVTIPASVTSIEEFVFESNPLETITFLGDQPTIGQQALGTFDSVSQDYEQATVIYDMANSGFGHPTWAPYSTGFPQYDDLEHPTAPVVTVSFDAGGHAADPASQTVALGGTLAEPASPASAGLTFLGWSPDAAGTDPWDFATDTVDAPTTLHAQWTAATSVVTFEIGHGLADALVEVEHGSAVVAPEPPFVPGHRFTGWIDQAGDPWDFSTVIEDDLTLAATYEASAYAVDGPAEATAGDALTVAGSGFDPEELVTIELHSTPVVLGTATADATGAFSTQVTIPADALAGNHELVAVGAAGQASTPLVVAAVPASEPVPADPAEPTYPPEAPVDDEDPADDDELAATGAAGVTAPLTAASALLLAGAALIALRRQVR